MINDNLYFVKTSPATENRLMSIIFKKFFHVNFKKQTLLMYLKNTEAAAPLSRGLSPSFIFVSVHFVMAAGNLRGRECFALVHIHFSDHFALFVHNGIRAALGDFVSAIQSH